MLTLTKVSTPIIGWLAEALGWIMNGIYAFFEGMGIANIGLCIIVFTLIVNLLMTPLRIKQQKNSKVQALISPEMQAIQKKYKGKTDQRSQQMQQAEIQALNEKYGFSPMGGCLPLLVEMPIILALYQVIYRIPAYVSSVRNLYLTVVNAALAHGGDFVTKITDLAKAVNVDPAKVDLTGATDASINSIIDLFAKFDATKWNTFYDTFSGIQSQVGTTVDHLTRSNTFLGINLMERPELLGISILIPILAGVFQFLAAKTMQVAPANNDDPNAGMMKGMNTTMPLISVVFCFMLPCGVGLYWVASSAIRFIQQVAVNGFLKNTSVEDIIEKNIEKRNKKREKQGLPPIRENASQNVRNLQRMKEEEERRERVLKERAAAARAEAGDAVNQPARQAPGGIAARAGMVKDFNERTKK